jgi:5'-methylthioadenosine/S-adenosylhomocysteine nucleosidase
MKIFFPTFHIDNYPKIDFSILSAMPKELAYVEFILSKNKFDTYIVNGFEFKVYQYKNKKILLSHTGLGTTFAASIITLIHHQFRPNYIFFSGTAGGINPDLKLRDVVIAEKAFEAEIQGAFQLLKNTPFKDCLIHPIKQQRFPKVYAADEELLNLASILPFADSTIYKGTVVSSNYFPAPKELFDKIKTENPLSIDMETSAIYQIAWLLNIRVIAVRGISNILNSHGADDAIHESDVESSSEAAAKIVLKIVDALSLKCEFYP